MSLRIFADHCIPNSVISDLKSLGHQVIRLKDEIPADSPDSLVIVKAKELNCILVSLDSDFSNIVIYPPKEYIGIISLQIKNHPEALADILNKLKEYFALNPKMEHYKGKLFLAEAHRIRVRK